MKDVKGLIESASATQATFDEIVAYFNNNELPAKEGRKELVFRFYDVFQSIYTNYKQTFLRSKITQDNLLEAYAHIFTLYALIHAHRDIFKKTLSAYTGGTYGLSGFRSSLGKLAGDLSVPGIGPLQSEGDKYIAVLDTAISGIEKDLACVQYHEARVLDLASILPSGQLTGKDLLVKPKHFTVVAGICGRDIYANTIREQCARSHVAEEGGKMALVTVAATVAAGPVGAIAAGAASAAYANNTGLQQVALQVYSGASEEERGKASSAYDMLTSVLNDGGKASRVIDAFTETEVVLPTPRRLGQS